MAPRAPKKEKQTPSNNESPVLMDIPLSAPTAEKKQTGNERAAFLATIMSDTSGTTGSSNSPAKPAVLKAKTERARVTKGVEKKVGKGKGGDANGNGKAEVKREVKDGKKEGKEKVEKVIGEEAEKLILGYLRNQNRPYGATDLSANLHGKVCFPSSSISKPWATSVGYGDGRLGGGKGMVLTVCV
jgi:hypothetical protein